MQVISEKEVFADHRGFVFLLFMPLFMQVVQSGCRLLVEISQRRLCLMFMCIFESCLHCGLIQTNTGYEQLFEVCTMGAQITDQDYHVIYTSANAMKLQKW